MEIIIIIGFALVLLAIFYVGHKEKKSESEPISDAFVLLQNQIHDLTRALDTRIAESSHLMHQSVRGQFEESAKLIREVTEGLTKLDETNKRVVSFTEELQSLQDILKNPKQRGILGEYYLETLLKNVFGPSGYSMQYRLGTDEEGNELIPDAVIFVKDKIIPVDSKFSLENYNKLAEAKDKTERERLEKLLVNDLKNRIVETSKYVQPRLNTMDFAFMFVPHEAIYYDLLVNTIGAVTEDTESLIERAARKYKVIIVSPTSLLAYLQTVLQGLRALEIEEKAKDIIKRVEELGKHMKSYEEYHVKLGNSLSTTVNQYNLAGKEWKKLDKDVLRLTGEKLELETPILDRPQKDE